MLIISFLTYTDLHGLCPRRAVNDISEEFYVRRNNMRLAKHANKLDPVLIPSFFIHTITLAGIFRHTLNNISS